MLDVLNKTYDNLILRRTTVPLFFSNPGIGKTSIIEQFAKDKGVKLIKITLSQRLPNEVVGMMMPNTKTGKLEVFDSYELSSLKEGDIVFFDEVFNGTLKQTLDATLNFWEGRSLPSGKIIKDIMLVGASNPQGLINITPQIKERFIKYDLKFNSQEYKEYLESKYGMPYNISNNICTLIYKEKFDSESWNYVTPRSVEKAINQIGCGLKTNYDDILLPYLNQEIEFNKDINTSIIDIKNGDKIKYIDILKLIIKTYNDKENRKQESRASSNILN
jgi:replication-associated recombination protein RarA